MVPVSHRQWWVRLCSAGRGLPTGGRSLVGGGLRRENRREKWWRVERESLVFRERGNSKFCEVLGIFGYIKRLPGLVWKFHDTRSIHKIRMNHLEPPVKFLSFILPLNRQLKVPPSKSSAPNLCTVTPVFLVLIPFFFREFTYPPVPLPNWTLIHIIP